MPRTRIAHKAAPAKGTVIPFDLASRYASDTAVVTIYDPADLGAKRDTGLRVEIHSLYSEQARAAAQAAAARQAGSESLDAAQVDFTENLFEQTVAVTARWWDINGAPDALLVDGVSVPCTPENVRRIYRDPRTAWLQKQVQAAYLDLGRFFPTPKGNS